MGKLAGDGTLWLGLQLKPLEFRQALSDITWLEYPPVIQTTGLYLRPWDTATGGMERDLLIGILMSRAGRLGARGPTPDDTQSAVMNLGVAVAMFALQEGVSGPGSYHGTARPIAGSAWRRS